MVVQILWLVRAIEPALHWLDLDTSFQSMLACELVEPKGPP